MLRRLVIGFVLGSLAGGAVAAGLFYGLGWQTFPQAGGAILAYLAAAVAGVLTGLVAGKPIWASGAKVEAGLKAFFGALIGAGLMFAIRHWAGSWVIDWPAIGATGPTPLPELPAASLPLLAAVLGGLFGLDNTGDSDDKGPQRVGAGKARVGAQATAVRSSSARVAAGSDGDSVDDADVPPRRAKR